MLSGDPRHCAPYAHAALAAGSVARAVERLRVLHPEFRPIERSGHLRELAALLAQMIDQLDIEYPVCRLTHSIPRSSDSIRVIVVE